MNKNLSVLTSFLAFMIMLAPVALGASLDMQVSTGQQPQDRISSCPDTVLSDIDVMVTNLGGQTDTIKMTLDWPSDMGFIKPFQTLASGESASIDPFWITLSYNLEPGVYFAKVTAESSMTGDKVTKEIAIEVLRCHYISMVIDDDYEQSCRETEEPVAYDIDIENQGKFPETVELSASVGWAEFSRNRIAIQPGSSETVSLMLNPPSDVSAGLNTVFVTARSVDSYATATSSVEMDVVDCFDFAAELDPESQDACIGENRDYDLIITNKGDQEDEYNIDVPEWVFPDVSKVKLGPGESDVVTLTVAASEEGTRSFESVITSERDAIAQPLAVSGTIKAEECRGVAAIITPSSMDVCRGEKVDFSVSVKNTGSVESTYELNASFGELDRDKLTLEAGESKTVMLTMDTADLPDGQVMVDVTASDGAVSDSATATVGIENCFDAELSVHPDDVNVCPGATVPYTIKVTNTGKKKDSYSLSFGDEKSEFDLEAGDSRTVSHDFALPYIEEGRYLFTTELDSEGGLELLETSEINMKSSDTCFGVELSDDIGIVDVGKANTVEIAVKNTGEEPDNFSITMTESPGWVYLEPTHIELAGGEESTTYLYLSPGFGTKMGEYTVSIKAASENSMDELDVKVIVPENVSLTYPEPSGPNETQGLSNVSINVTHPNGNVSDRQPAGNGTPVTGGAVEERPFWKTAAVAFIALVIIAILVLRFVLLLRK